MVRGRELDRALPLAALDLVRAGAVPVYELLHRLEAELGRQGEVLNDSFEALSAGPLSEGIELLALGPIRLIKPQPTLDRLGDSLGRKARLQSLSEYTLAALEIPANVRNVGGHLAIANF